MKGVDYPFLNSNTFKLSDNKYGFFCVNVYIKNIVSDKYKNDLKKIIKSSDVNSNINEEERQIHFKTSSFRKQYFSTKSGNSLKWSLVNISDEMKQSHDNFLRRNNYNKIIDKYAIYTEGCEGKETFIGGGSELINMYCNLFPNSDYCVEIYSKANLSGFDTVFKKVVDKPDVSDMFFDNLTNIFKDE